jgi:phospholipase C
VASVASRKTKQWRLALFAVAQLAVIFPSAQAQTGTIQDVKHVVILMQENRSFDSYYGTLGGVRGFGDRNTVSMPNGNPTFFQPTNGGSNYVLPFLTAGECGQDVDHSHATGLDDWDGGRWDQWVPAKGVATMSYFTRDLLPFHFGLADAYTICDNYFCSLIGPTYPNRLFLFTGTVDPEGVAGGPAVANQVPPGGYSWTTYPERLQSAGVSWRVYRPVGDWFGDPLPWFSNYMAALPGNPLYDRGVATVPDVLAAFLSDVTNGVLPQVSWVIPQTLGYSEHPPYSPSDGAYFVKRVMDAIATNPAVFNSTVLFLNYDENGGFFDHVPSPTPPPGTKDEFVAGQPLGLGVRVPMTIISPWSQGGRVCSQVFDHTSVIRFLETWTGVQETNISRWRRQVCGDLTSAFDFAHPVTNYPGLTNMTPFDTSPLTQTVPLLQTMPRQDTNSRLSMPLPYQPEVTAQTMSTGGQVVLTFTNAGAASVHLAVYANFAQTNYPWQFDVNSAQSLTNSFAVSSLDTNTYDFTCAGPNGFQRRFAGSLQSDAGQIEASANLDTNGGDIVLTMYNSSTNEVHFVVIDGYGKRVTSTNDLSSGANGTWSFPAVALNNGWYDLEVRADSDPKFLRKFTGRIETGLPAPSEPVLPQITPLVATHLMTQASFDTFVSGLASALATNSLALYAKPLGQNMLLAYPSWACDCMMQSSPTGLPGSWSPISGVLNYANDYNVSAIPMDSTMMFFRLQR